METLGLIKEVGAYSERQYQRQDGTTEYFKSRVKGYWKHRTWQDQNGQIRHENALYITDLQSL